MPQPIYNIILAAGLDPKNMESIEKTAANVNKLKDAFRNRWKDKIISDEDICKNLIDYKEAPDWIIKASEQERSAIQDEIKKGIKK
jgi:hypothetical protein